MDAVSLRSFLAHDVLTQQPRVRLSFLQSLAVQQSSRAAEQQNLFFHCILVCSMLPGISAHAHVAKTLAKRALAPACDACFGRLVS